MPFKIAEVDEKRFPLSGSRFFRQGDAMLEALGPVELPSRLTEPQRGALTELQRLSRSNSEYAAFLELRERLLALSGVSESFIVATIQADGQTRVIADFL